MPPPPSGPLPPPFLLLQLSRGELLERVRCVIGLLGMAHIQHIVVGNTRKRGISGGQRKRVNIGMELVASPSVLFLDEPTRWAGGVHAVPDDSCTYAVSHARDVGLAHPAKACTPYRAVAPPP